jgi:hypothetical protein
MAIQRFRSTRPLLTVVTILVITAVTSCSSSNTTRAAAGGVSSTPGATPTAMKLTALGQRDAISLSLRAKQYLNAVAKQYLNPVLDISGTWSVFFSRAASSESGQLGFGSFTSPDGENGGSSPSAFDPKDYKAYLQENKARLEEFNQVVASACGTTWSTVLDGGRSTGSTFLTAELRGDESSDSVLQIQEWDAVAPSAAVQALTQVATTCGSRLVIGSSDSRRPLLTSSAQSVQVLGSPAVAIQSMETPGREPLNSLIAFSGTRMLAVSSQGWNDGAPDKPPLPNGVLTQLASALLHPSGG